MVHCLTGPGPETAHDAATGEHPSRYHCNNHSPALCAVFCTGPQAQRRRSGYSVVALLFFVPLFYHYFTHRHLGPQLWAVPASGTVEWLLGLANAIGLVLLVAGPLLKPVPGSVTRTPREPRTALTPDRQQKERPTREASAQSGGNDVAA